VQSNLIYTGLNSDQTKDRAIKTTLERIKTMKRNILAAIIATSLIAPSVTLAQSVDLDFPTFYPEFTQKAAQPVAKLNIETASKTTVSPTKASRKN
jgi:hypothetical protein